MAKDQIDQIMEQRRQVEKPAEPVTSSEADKFFLVVATEGTHENYLELKFSVGVQACFSYGDLQWFNLDPESGCLDLAFGSFLVTLKGRGLQDLFAELKHKRVAWVREAASDLQDHAGNTVFIEKIEISVPPPDSADEEESMQAAA